MRTESVTHKTVLVENDGGDDYDEVSTEPTHKVFSDRCLLPILLNCVDFFGVFQLIWSLPILCYLLNVVNSCGDNNVYSMIK